MKIQHLSALCAVFVLNLFVRTTCFGADGSYSFLADISTGSVTKQDTYLVADESDLRTPYETGDESKIVKVVGSNSAKLTKLTGSSTFPAAAWKELNSAWTFPASYERYCYFRPKWLLVLTVTTATGGPHYYLVRVCDGCKEITFQKLKTDDVYASDAGYDEPKEHFQRASYKANGPVSDSALKYFANLK